MVFFSERISRVIAFSSVSSCRVVKATMWQQLQVAWWMLALIALKDLLTRVDSDTLCTEEVFPTAGAG